MEVHAHTHTPRKKWTHYFWEFLMLFLAVTLGFFVENQREHFIEHKREKQFIRSMLADLKSDTVQLADVIRIRERRERLMDSLQLIIENHEQKLKGGDLYFFAHNVHRWRKFVSNDRTINQLKNTGGLRIIRKQLVSDSIIYYDQKVREVYSFESFEDDLVKSYIYQVGSLYNSSVFEELYKNRLSNVIDYNKRPANNPQLADDDPRLLRDHYSRVLYIKHTSVFLRTYILVPLKEQAEELISLIQKEYYLK